MALTRWLGGAALLTGAGLGLTEVRYRRHPGNAVSYANEDWSWGRQAPDHFSIGGRVVVRNQLARREVMLCDVQPEVHLLSRRALEGLRVSARVLSHEEDYPTRP